MVGGLRISAPKPSASGGLVDATSRAAEAARPHDQGERPLDTSSLDLRPRPVPPVAPHAQVAQYWVIERGRSPVFSGGRAPDGAPGPSRIDLRDRPTLSTLMTDMHRRELPAGLEQAVCPKVPWSMLRARLEAITHHPLLARFREVGAPPELVTRYVLAEILATGATPEGRFDLATFRGKYLPIEADALLACIGAHRPGPRLKSDEDAPFEISMLFDEAWWSHREQEFDTPFPALVAAIGNAQVQEAKAPMALLEAVVEKYGTARPDDFVWAREHILGSNATRLAARRYARVGKGYSSSTPVLVHESLFHGLRGGTMDQTVSEPEGEALLDSVALGLAFPGQSSAMQPLLELTLLIDGLYQCLLRPIDRFQVVDSGASALLLLNAQLAAPETSLAPEVARWLKSAAARGAISGVEHTRDGARQLRNADLAFPVVDAAESPVKLNMVALLIAWSIVEEVGRHLDDLEASGIRTRDREGKRQTLLTGYGSTGRRVAALLSEAGHVVTVKDPDPLAQEDARRAGFTALSEVSEGCRFNVVLGCVGLPSLTPEELGRLPDGAVLFSGSSANKEFPFLKNDGWKLEPIGRKVQDLRIQFQGRRLRYGTPSASNQLHWNRVARRPDGRELLLIRSLYPVNLTGHPDPISPELVQLIRALMLLASFQARSLDKSVRGLVPLDPSGQRFIAERFMEIVRALDPPLPPPILARLEAEHVKTRAELERSLI